MLVKKTKYSLFELYKLDIKTRYWEQYGSSDQFKPNTAYTIGIVKSWNNDRVFDSKECKTLKEQLEHAAKLSFKYGLKAIIVILAEEHYSYTGTITIDKDGHEVVGIVSDSDAELIKGWVSILSRDYSFDNPLICLWGKRIDDGLVVTGIY